MSSVTSSRSLYTGFGVVAILLWSTVVAFGRSVTEGLGPVTSAAFVNLIGGILGCIYLALTTGVQQTVRGLSTKYLVGCGGMFVGYMLVLFLALGMADGRRQVLEVALVNYLWSVMILLFSILLLKMRANLWLLPGVFAAVAGMFLATGQNQPLSAWVFAENMAANGLPYLMALLAAASWALYSVLSRKWGSSDNVAAVPLFMLATGMILLVVRLGVAEETTWTAQTVYELLYMAIGPNIAYVLWEHAVRKGDIVVVASAAYFTPLLSTVVSCIYLDVVPGSRLWIGCVGIVLGAVVCTRSVREPAPSV
ncbi:MAG: aromatic amino acid DMT transporter YddG [Candidatus Latescibacteria bacterium]|jgi:drug/metabolite transporter (DMT)-like permease|nr:aromatic amino acid DMT transporter YddG [Candidatus Latescibacterota bacterium]